MLSTVLMVAEKPSLAEAISKNLAPGSRYETRRSITPVHEWEGSFRGRPVKFKFTSVTGHVYNIDFANEFNNWDVDPLKLFSAPIKKLEANPKMHLTRHLQSEAKGVDYLVLWLDCDREGENICFEVMANVVPNMNGSNNEKDSRVFRARFSAIASPDLLRAMETLGRPNKNESLAVEARQELDLKVGVAFTRFQTRFFQGRYGNLDSTVISYGPCQTPTLSFCVERHDQIQSFEPEPFWFITATIQKSVETTTTLRLDWERGRIFDKHVASVILGMIRQEREAIVTSVSSSKQTRSRPHALNTVELLKFGSSYLGIGSHEVMNIAERLYTKGYISYPRTETSLYPPSFDIHEVLREQSRHSLWGEYCKDLLQGFDRPTGGTDVGDHPPITPMRLANESDLSGSEWKIYDFVARTFIGSVSPNLKYTKTSIKVRISGEMFETSGIQVTSAGFTKIMHWRSMSDEYMPEFSQNDKLNIVELKLNEGRTSPPDYLTESEVIELMEKNGIGTDASIPTHINNICQRNYVSVQGASRRLVPTNLGTVLIHGYQKIDPELSLPTMRSDVEKQLNLIAEDKASHKEVLEYFLQMFERKFEYFTKKIDQMDELFEATFSPLAATGRVLSKCGKCKRYMKYISIKPQRLHCKTCDETYSLPQNGSIKLYNERICPLDEFQLILFSTGSKGMGFPICPYCYNFPPFENVKKGMGCNHCPHPTCPHSMTKNAVCPCPQSENATDQCKGALILDATSAPRWKLSCNECNIVSSFLDTIKGVKILNDLCDCGAGLLRVEFRENQNKEPMEGCIIDDENMAALLETRFARRSNRGSRGGGRGRGRGRRRGRKSGGRGGH